jgi:sulfite reductase (ferredoxin)
MAELLDPFVPEAELLPLAQAVCRVFARLGERKNRARARLKFVVQKLGIEEFRRVVLEERASIPADERWTTYLDDVDRTLEQPLRPGRALEPGDLPPGFAAWRETNLRPQPQPGYAVATVRLPLGDVTSDQMRALADLARRYTGDTVRLTVEQNVAFRWVPEGDLPAFYRDLQRLQLAQAGAGHVADVVACPGTDTCKLGISSSRGLAAQLEQRLGSRTDLHPDARKLHVKASGCFNSCAQHHVTDIGFLGVSRNVGGRRVAHFQLVLGGEWSGNGASYGLAVGAFPSKRVPEVVDRIVDHWLRERREGERLQEFIRRVGRGKVKEALEDLARVPAYEEDPSFYKDWADDREYTIGDMGTGECAGEVVSLAQFGLAASEREVFEAQVHLDGGDPLKAGELAYRSMLSAATALIRIQNIDVTEDPDVVVEQFRVRFHETGLFHDRYAGAKFAMYLLKRHERGATLPTPQQAHRDIEEAQLFIEAAHACYDRMQEQPVA